MNFIKSYKCPKCSNDIIINLKDYVVDIQENDKDNGMGSQSEYFFEYDNTCSNCKSNYLISGSIWEYPVGTENLDTTTLRLVSE